MKKIHIYAKTPNSGYGGCGYIHKLKFYDVNGNEMPVSNISTTNSEYDCSFSIKGIKGAINMPLPYGGYYLKNIFATTAVYAMFQNNTSAAVAKKGFTITFEKDVPLLAGLSLVSTYYKATGFVASVDDGEYINFTNTGDLNEVKFPDITVRCFLGKNGKYYFLRPKAKNAI